MIFNIRQLIYTHTYNITNFIDNDIMIVNIINQLLLLLNNL